MMHYYGMGYGYLGLGWLFQVIILVMFFLVVWWIIKSSGSFGYKIREQDTALEILKKRLAKGEITLKQFEHIRKEIEE